MTIAPARTRCATIEIGSRAVRLLVAEITVSRRLAVLASDWRETGLAAALVAGGTAVEAKIAEIVQVVGAFREKSRAHGVTRLCLFATEAVRQLKENQLAILRSGIQGLEVIDRRTEACCALLGAVSPFEVPAPTPLNFVVDQGSGSMELAVGVIGDAGVELQAYKSYRLGTTELVQDLAECGADFKKLQGKLTTRVKALKLLEVEPSLRAIVLGSAATKMAWMMVRKNPSDRYDPSKVHGRIIELSVIDNLVKMACAAPDAIRGVVDPTNPKSSEFETVITGLLAIRIFLAELGKKDFKVSAYGPRYGVLWMAAFYGKLGTTI